MRILGVDLGVASVGWALVDDKNNEIIDSGVRIFTQSTNKDGKTLAAVRREFRGSRRVLSRKKQRLNQLKKLFITHKLLSKSEFEHLFNSKNRLDVWQLRAKGLERQLNNKEWARVLYHIAKRRAYQSNRKSEENGNDDKKKVLGNFSKNEQKMYELGYKTIGAMLYTESRYPDDRTRRNKKDQYKHSISRGFLREEIDVLFKSQRGFGNQFVTDELKKHYEDIAFTQRPIKFKADLVGKCTFETKEYRGAKNCFSVEKSTLLSKINNTDLIDKDTGEIKRLFEFSALDKLFDIFYSTKEVKYTTLRKKLKIPNSFEFKQLDYHQDFEYKTNIKAKVEDFYKLEYWLSLEQKALLEKQVLDDKKEKFKRYKYSSIRSILSLPVSQKFVGVKYDTKVENTVFGKLNGYHSIKKELNKEVFELLFTNKDKFNKIAEILSYQKDDKSATQDLKKQVFNDLNMDETVVNEAINGLLNISFSGFNSLSLKVINELLPYLWQGLKYHDAVANSEYKHHSQFKATNPQQYLRPLNKEENYQITNPTVKRVFSQFRKVLNAVIRKHGSFDTMHIEMARELKNSKKRKFEIQTGQKEYAQEKEVIRAKFLEIFEYEGSGKDLLKLRLYEQQYGKCIYSKEEIKIERLLEKGYVEIDHILPWSRTFDNSLNNRVLCLIAENQNKANQTPFEYLANSNKDSKKWQKYKNYVSSFASIKQAKKNKLLNTTLPQRRGNDLSYDDIENHESGFLARNLNDTAYASKFIKNFVQNHLQFSQNDTIKQKVKVRSGALTNQLRYNWDIEEKNRGNTLHHAEDAIILAFATQGEVQRMSTISAEREDFKYQTAEERKIKFTPPFANFRNAIDKSIDKIFVSFAPRRKIAGAAHRATIKTRDTGGKYKFSVNQGMAENGVIQRVDVFANEKGKYQFVVFYPSDFYKDDFPELDLNGNEIDENSEFLFSLFKDDLIEFKTKKTKTKDSKHLLVYFKYIQSDGRIAFQQNYKAETERKESDNKKGYTKVLLATGSGLVSLKKYQVSVLGGIAEVKNEKRLPLIKQIHKSKAKKK